MPAVLTDPPSTLWVLLILFALVSVGLWLRSRNRTAGIVALVAVLLPVLLFLCRFAGESPRQEATHRMNAVIAAMEARNPDDMLPHVAEDFDYHGQKKNDIKTSQLWDLLRRENPKLTTKMLDVLDDPPDENTVFVDFNAWATARGQEVGPLFVRATFKKDTNGKWKIRTMWASTDQVKKAKGDEFMIPGLGR